MLVSESGPEITSGEHTALDRAMMALALDQARSVRGRVAPNPAVGAVVARADHCIAAGATQPPPGSHAEVVALQAAGQAAFGADLYVTLEPCSSHGRTPPCTRAILDAGIQRVIVAMRDPNPVVDGRGIAQLRAAGIRVDVGLGAEDAAGIVAGFSRRILTGRPLVTAKYAMTLDGRIATRTGDSRWISGLESRHHAHHIRDQVDAILVGVGTVLVDDPLLTTRLAPGQSGVGGNHHPLRVVLDTRARIPTSARMLSAGAPGHTLVLVGPEAPMTNVRRLRRAGAAVAHLRLLNGHVDPSAVLDYLGQIGVDDLLIEGGQHIHGAFFDAKLVDCVRLTISPSIVGGLTATPPVGGDGVSLLRDAARITNCQILQLGDDLIVEGRVTYPAGSAEAEGPDLTGVRSEESRHASSERS